jgi:hypothetical protein
MVSFSSVDARVLSPDSYSARCSNQIQYEQIYLKIFPSLQKFCSFPSFCFLLLFSLHSLSRCLVPSLSTPFGIFRSLLGGAFFRVRSVFLYTPLRYVSILSAARKRSARTQPCQWHTSISDAGNAALAEESVGDIPLRVDSWCAFNTGDIYSARARCHGPQGRSLI